MLKLFLSHFCSSAQELSDICGDTLEFLSQRNAEDCNFMKCLEECFTEQLKLNITA